MFISCAGNEYDYDITWRYKEGVSPSICFMGDSRIEWFKTENYFTNKQWNIAKAGMSTQGLLLRKELVVSFQPDIVIISAGVNDWQDNYEGTALRIEETIVYLKKYIPRIIVTNIVPATDTNYDIYNTEIEKACIRNEVEYLKLIDLELPSGFINPDYADEREVYRRLHYNEAGYNVISNMIHNRL
jgi:lysophospholipase L1-like esterase